MRLVEIPWKRVTHGNPYVKISVRTSSGVAICFESGCRKREKRLAIALPYARDRRYIGQPLIPKNGVILHLESARVREEGGLGQEDFLDWNKVAVAPVRRGGSFSGFVERRPIAGIVALLYHNGPIGMLSVSFQHHCHPSAVPAVQRNPSRSHTFVRVYSVYRCVYIIYRTYTEIHMSMCASSEIVDSFFVACQNETIKSAIPRTRFEDIDSLRNSIKGFFYIWYINFLIHKTHIETWYHIYNYSHLFLCVSYDQFYWLFIWTNYDYWYTFITIIITLIII